MPLGHNSPVDQLIASENVCDEEGRQSRTYLNIKSYRRKPVSSGANILGFC